MTSTSVSSEAELTPAMKTFRDRILNYYRNKLGMSECEAQRMATRIVDGLPTEIDLEVLYAKRTTAEIQAYTGGEENTAQILHGVLNPVTVF